MPPSSAWLATFTLVTVTACSGNDQGPARSGDVAAAREEVHGEVVIPTRTVDSGPIRFRPAAQLGGDPESPKLTLDGDLRLVVGEGYSSRFRVLPPASLFLACGFVGDVEMSLSELDARPGAIDVSLAPDGALSFEVREAGETSLVARGKLEVGQANQCGLPIGVAMPIEVRVVAQAVRPAGSRFVVPSRCQDAAVPRVAVSTAPASPSSDAGTSFDLEVVLVDEAGNDISAGNVAGDAPMTVRARGVFPKSLLTEPPASVAQIEFSSTKGRVEFVPELGAPFVVEVVDAAEISDAEIQFQLAGMGGESVLLENGLVYGENGWARVANRIGPMVRNAFVDADPLCSPPNTGWFELTTLTPKVCQVVPMPTEEANQHDLFGDSSGQGAEILQDGTCSLSLSMPGFAQGAGVTRSFAATFQNVAQLHSW